MEASAKWRLDRLRILSTPTATVVRDGIERSIDPSAGPVRGDVLAVKRGDQVVLDAEMVDGEIEVDGITPDGRIGSHPAPPGRRLPLRQRLRVGLRTHTRDPRRRGELREPADRAGAVDARGRPALPRGVDRLIAVTTILVVLVSLVVAVSSRLGAGQTTAEIAQAAAVLVALVPQGLAIMITVTYATAAFRISRAGALVQRINSVESMSRVDTLVLDKTGTITVLLPASRGPAGRDRPGSPRAACRSPCHPDASPATELATRSANGAGLHGPDSGAAHPPR